MRVSFIIWALLVVCIAGSNDGEESTEPGTKKLLESASPLNLETSSILDSNTPSPNATEVEHTQVLNHSNDTADELTSSVPTLRGNFVRSAWNKVWKLLGYTASSTEQAAEPILDKVSLNQLLKENENPIVDSEKTEMPNPDHNMNVQNKDFEIPDNDNVHDISEDAPSTGDGIVDGSSEQLLDDSNSDNGGMRKWVTRIFQSLQSKAPSMKPLTKYFASAESSVHSNNFEKVDIANSADIKTESSDDKLDLTKPDTHILTTFNFAPTNEYASSHEQSMPEKSKPPSDHDHMIAPPSKADLIALQRKNDLNTKYNGDFNKTNKYRRAIRQNAKSRLASTNSEKRGNIEGFKFTTANPIPDVQLPTNLKPTLFIATKTQSQPIDEQDQINGSSSELNVPLLTDTSMDKKSLQIRCFDKPSDHRDGNNKDTQPNDDLKNASGDGSIYIGSAVSDTGDFSNDSTGDDNIFVGKKKNLFFYGVLPASGLLISSVIIFALVKNKQVRKNQKDELLMRISGGYQTADSFHA